MSEKLLPCPFCGGEAEKFTIEDDADTENFGGDVIVCKSCGASSSVEFGFKENLVSNWNRRAAPKGDRRMNDLHTQNAALASDATAARNRVHELLAEVASLKADLERAKADGYSNLCELEDKDEEIARLHEAERTAWERGRDAAAGIAIEVASYGSSDDSSYDAGRIYAAKRIHREICALSPEAKINWRDDPDAIVEDDEPQIGRDYA